jgi:hypothetical protein
MEKPRNIALILHYSNTPRLTLKHPMGEIKTGSFGPGLFTLVLLVQDRIGVVAGRR